MPRRLVAARRRVWAALPIALFCVAASLACAQAANAHEVGAARETVRYVLGAPYQAAGRWYVPAVQPGYAESGSAGLYVGARRTADGERFDRNAVSGAHATLPLPCIVEVTNLATGRRLEVRVNDRSPDPTGRILDLSPAAAGALGVEGASARVSVRYLGPASLQPTGVGRIARRGPDATRPPAPGFGVQAGAYGSRAAAQRVADRLAVAGNAAVVPLDREGVRLYRVIVGGLPDAEAAEQARGRVAGLGFTDARIVGSL